MKLENFSQEIQIFNGLVLKDNILFVGISLKVWFHIQLKD